MPMTMPLKSSVIAFQNVPSGSRDSFHLFHSSSSGKNSSTSLPTTEDPSPEPSPSYFSSTKKYSSGRPYRIPKVFYPVQMNRKLRDMETWENAFIQLTAGRPLLTSPDKIPPKPVILDLACGYGAWSILAARYFEESRVVGFDIKNIQPNLKELKCDDLAERLTWVHGDMLRRLPFEDDTFDVVKSQYIELCVPDFKWEDLLKVNLVINTSGLTTDLLSGN